MLVEKNPEITKATDALYQMSLNHERGDIITWEQIEEISGPRAESMPWTAILKWRRRMFNERDIVLDVVRGVGVELLTHQKTATVIPKKRQKRAYRQIRRALKETSTVDVGRLSTHERRMLAAQRDHMTTQRRQLFRSQKELAKGIVKTEVNPRRKQTA